MYSKILYNFIVCFFVITTSSLAQNDLIFNQLDLSQQSIKDIGKLYNTDKKEKAFQALLDYYKKKKNLYLQIDKKNLSFIKDEYPQEVSKTIEVANQVLNNYFLYRYDWDMEKTNIPYQFKNHIDWTAMPNGDEEWCFMLNRHRFWIDLGKAYFITGKEKYAKGFVEQVTDWIDKNPLKKEEKLLTWRRIEAGIRCENWIKTFEYVKNSKHVTPEFLIKFLSSLYQHGELINSSFSYFSKTSNWGVIEYQGLFNVALFLKELKIAKEWQNNALSKLETCINLQVLADGTQWEQSPMYHNEVFHCYLNVNLLAQRQEIKISKDIKRKTQAMAYANIGWQKPNYNQPLLGDSDDTDLRGLLTLAAYVFQDPVLKSRAYKILDYDSFFLLGRQKASLYKTLKSKTPDFLTTFQESSGDLYMRTSWNEDATYTSFHGKKLGCGHGHDNILHFNIYANRRDYLVDPGRYTYVNNKWRSFFKSSLNHNTLAVDDLPNSIYESSWTNSFEARSQGIYTKSFKAYDYAEAENIAYQRLKNPVSLKRRMLFLKPNIWVIFDSFISNGEHKYSQFFNFPNTKAEIKNNTIETTYKDHNLRIQPVNQGDIVLTNSWYSAEYNLKTPSLKAEISKRAKGFSSFITLMYFPEHVNLKYEKVPVYGRTGVLIKDENAEAVKFYCNNKTYVLFVQHNAIATGNYFFIVEGQFINGEVVLIEKSNNDLSVEIIKE